MPRQIAFFPRFVAALRLTRADAPASRSCGVTDVLASTLRAGCSDCSEASDMPPFTRGRHNECCCHTCHSKMVCKVGALRIEDVGGVVARAGGRRGAGGRAGGSGDELTDQIDAFKKVRGAGCAVIRDGEPLPDMGKCEPPGWNLGLCRGSPTCAHRLSRNGVRKLRHYAPSNGTPHPPVCKHTHRSPILEPSAMPNKIARRRETF